MLAEFSPWISVCPRSSIGSVGDEPEHFLGRSAQVDRAKCLRSVMSITGSEMSDGPIRLFQHERSVDFDRTDNAVEVPS